ncbi:hypothetical protein [Candidatus Sarmatiella mevalonica]
MYIELLLPLTEENFTLMMPYADTECMSIFLAELSIVYSDHHSLHIPLN